MNNRRRKKTIYKCYYKEFHFTVLFWWITERSPINYRGLGRKLAGEDKKINNEVVDRINKLNIREKE